MNNRPPNPIDSSKPSVAGMLEAAGGGRSRAVDHRTIAGLAERWPDVVDAAQDDRPFPGRAVRHVTAEYGISQFLNLGCGKPSTAGTNLHDLYPGRWVQVDADPEVRAVGDALLNSPTAAYLEADARDVDDVLRSAEVSSLLDLQRPVCVLAAALWHYVPDEDRPADLMRAYMDAVPPGSVLVFSHACSDGLDAGLHAEISAIFAETFTGGIWPRPAEDLQEFLSGLEILEPGLVLPGQWRADRELVVPVRSLRVLGCVAVKP